MFVSSTYEDLKPERDQVIKGILEMGHIPVGMEMFSAGDEQQWDVIKKQIEQSDYYVVIVAHRYGSMDGNLSYTEKEYDYAVSLELPTLGFILETDVEWPAEWIENNKDIHKRLESFKTKVSRRMVSYWKSADDLYGKCGIALMKAFNTHPREGWVRASSANTGEMPEEITRLSKENGTLWAEIRKLKSNQIDEESERINQVIDALRLNSRAIYVWLLDADDWGDPIQTDMLAIFEAVAPDLMDEASNAILARALAVEFGGDINFRSDFPVPANFIKSYLADFASFDLIGNSTKKHSVSDTKAYWSLTEFGRKVHDSIRKNELLKGLTDFEETPEEDLSSGVENASDEKVALVPDE
ncbi:MAG: DUF4062 domain-containing protein [Alphaproteobacteria bacterium]|nr:DUF4062 domain-containing protein [Alphaproteobacteria bacterium]